MAKQEFRVKWIEHHSRSAHANKLERKQLHVMQMLKTCLDEGGYTLSHTEPDGTSVYVRGE